MSYETNDMRRSLLDLAQALRDNYRCEPNPWVLPPRIYDEAERQIEAGTAKPETIVVMRNAVRAEEM